LAAAMLAVSLAGFAHVLNQTGSQGNTDTAPQPRDEPLKMVVCFGHVDVEGGVQRIVPLQSGRVAEVFVRPGQTVAEGTPLLKIEDKLSRTTVQTAQENVNAAQLELAEARKEPDRYKEQVELQKLKVEALTERVRSLRAVLDQMRRVREESGGGVTLADIEKTQGELKVAEIELQGAEMTFSALQRRDSLVHARLLECKLAIAKAQLEQAKAAADEYTIPAPSAGTVLRVNVRKGDVVAPGSQQLPPIEFAHDGRRYVRAEVPQASAARVTEGLPARITDDTHAGGTWTGHVTYVSDWFARKRSVLQEPMQFNDEQTLECWITLDPNQPKLRINQRVRVYIQIGH
jgi:multidrug resistance efflux pump